MTERTFPAAQFNGATVSKRVVDPLRDAHEQLVKDTALARPPSIGYYLDADDVQAHYDHLVKMGKVWVTYAQRYVDQLAPHLPEQVNNDFPNQLIDTLDTIFSQLEKAADRLMQVDPLTGEPV